MKSRLLPAVALIVYVVCLAWCSARPVNPAWQPNLGFSPERRCFTPDEPFRLDVSGFNVKRASLSVYPLDVTALVQRSGDVDKLPEKLDRLPLDAERP